MLHVVVFVGVKKEDEFAFDVLQVGNRIQFLEEVKGCLVFEDGHRIFSCLV